jgi:hypothetical protein
MIVTSGANAYYIGSIVLIVIASAAIAHGLYLLFGGKGNGRARKSQVKDICRNDLSPGHRSGEGE